MSGFAARAALVGEDAGFVAGITWVPEDVLDTLVFGTGASGPAESLETLVLALGLDFAFVPGDESWSADAVARLHEAGAAAIWAISGVLGRLGESVGWTDVLRKTASEPGALAGPLGEALHDALDETRRGVASGADAILVADDLAGATGPLVSPDFALDALVPCYASVAGEARRGELSAVFHSDGDVRALFPALARSGLSAVHLAGLSSESIESSARAARAAGMAVLGGIEATALSRGARRLGEHAAAMALEGGMLICDDGGITSAEEVAALATAIEAARSAFSAQGDSRA
jgi:hypothetical protein